MRSEPFTRTDGTSGTRFKPDHGDIVTAEFDTVAEFEHMAIKDKGKATAKPIKIISYVLKVKTSNNEIINLVLTGGMAKNLKREQPLKGKQIKFEKYNHKQYGELLGARVVK